MARLTRDIIKAGCRENELGDHGYDAHSFTLWSESWIDQAKGSLQMAWLFYYTIYFMLIVWE